MCRQARTAAAGKTASRNMHVLLVKHHGQAARAKVGLPRLVIFSVADGATPVSWACLLLTVFNKGEDAMPMDMAAGSEHGGARLYKPMVSDGSVALLTVNVVAKQLVAKDVACGIPDDTAAKSVTVACSSVQLRSGATGYEVAASEGWSEDLPLQQALRLGAVAARASETVDLPFGISVKATGGKPRDSASDSDSSINADGDVNSGADSGALGSEIPDGDEAANSPSVEDEEPAVDPAAPLPHVPGLKQYGRAASGKAQCFLCSSLIPVGSLPRVARYKGGRLPRCSRALCQCFACRDEGCRSGRNHWLEDPATSASRGM